MRTHASVASFFSIFFHFYFISVSIGVGITSSYPYHYHIINIGGVYWLPSLGWNFASDTLSDLVAQGVPLSPCKPLWMASDANYGSYRRKKSNPTPRLSPKNKEHHGTDAIIIRTWYCSFAVTAAIAVRPDRYCSVP